MMGAFFGGLALGAIFTSIVWWMCWAAINDARKEREELVKDIRRHP